jgi:hypothetical protein
MDRTGINRIAAAQNPTNRLVIHHADAMNTVNSSVRIKYQM